MKYYFIYSIIVTVQKRKLISIVDSCRFIILKNVNFYKNNEPDKLDDCTFIYDTSDIVNCDDFELTKLISIYNNNKHSNESYNDYISIYNNVL